jgi:hypothetical protein
MERHAIQDEKPLADNVTQEMQRWRETMLTLTTRTVFFLTLPFLIVGSFHIIFVVH